MSRGRVMRLPSSGTNPCRHLVPAILPSSLASLGSLDDRVGDDSSGWLCWRVGGEAKSWERGASSESRFLLSDWFNNQSVLLTGCLPEPFAVNGIVE
jgi:hypothetical protein